MHKLLLRDLDVTNKRVLMRVDFNVPLNPSQRITDETRLIASLPSIQDVLARKGKLILMSHLGRPKGERQPQLSLKPVADRLSELLHTKVDLAPDCVGPEVEKMAQELAPGRVLLLENLRFHPGEEKPDKEPGFARSLANLGEVYVNDAFGTAHRSHTSTVVITQFFPGLSAAGLLLENEIEYLGTTLAEPHRPFTAIIGGAKVSSKLGVLEALVTKVDRLMIGGGMAYTFLKAEGYNVGGSLLEKDLIPAAKRIIQKCAEHHVALFLPVDLVVADDFSNDATSLIIKTQEGVPIDYEGMDIGPETIDQWKTELMNDNTILWNGPVGVFEFPSFAHGTFALAHLLASLSAVTIIGGGDSAAAINAAGVADKMTHICTGGGAALEYIQYGHLPGIDALSDA